LVGYCACPLCWNIGMSDKRLSDNSHFEEKGIVLDLANAALGGAVGGLTGTAVSKITQGKNPPQPPPAAEKED